MIWGESMLKRISKKYIVLIAISILLTPNAVEAAYEARQAMHFGSEWLLVPLAVLMGLVVDSFKASYIEYKRSMNYDQRIDG